MSEPRDVIIIGSGPSGYSAAIYAARAALRPLVFEGSVTVGGALVNTTEVENFPGFPDGVQGPALMAAMRDQAQRFGAELVTDDVVGVDLDGDVNTVHTDTQTYTARTVILATGSRYKGLGLARENELSGRGVSWCATCDGFFFRDKAIAVVGGGDSAIEEATFLPRFGQKVHLLHRRDKLRASKIMQERAFADPKLEIVWNTEVVEILGRHAVDGVTLRDTATGETRRLDVSALFIAIGHKPRSERFQGQVDIDENGYVHVSHPTTAAGTGAAAALDAERHLATLDNQTLAATPA
ncbi:NAD(P)/FAD-dependent oxidoreductase [Amycolatopsis lurida]